MQLRLDFAQFFSARRLTPPSRSRSCLSAVERASIVGDRRQFGARLDLGEAARAAGSASRNVADLVRDVGEPALAASRRSSRRVRPPRAPRRTRRARARAAVGLGEFGLGRGQPIGGRPARGIRGLDLADQRLAFSEIFAARLSVRLRSLSASSMRCPIVAICAAALSPRSSRPARSSAIAWRRRWPARPRAPTPALRATSAQLAALARNQVIDRGKRLRSRRRRQRGLRALALRRAGLASSRLA